jgi:hypothetical protein
MHTSVKGSVVHLDLFIDYKTQVEPHLERLSGTWVLGEGILS